MTSPRYLDKLNKSQRKQFAGKIIDWGNLVFAGLVIAQVVPGTGAFQPLIFIVGLAALVSAFGFAYLLTQEEGGE